MTSGGGGGKARHHCSMASKVTHKVKDVNYSVDKPPDTAPDTVQQVPTVL